MHNQDKRIKKADQFFRKELSEADIKKASTIHLKTGLGLALVSLLAFY